MNRSFLAILSIILVVVPTVAATVDRDAADQVLLAPVHAVHAALYQAGDAERDSRVQDAMDSGAYRWALTIVAEAVSEQRTEAIWSASRSQQDPYAAYATGLGGWTTEAMQELTGVAQRLEQAERVAHPTPREAEWLLFAAQYTVLAESSLSLGGRLIATAGEDAERHDAPSKRHILAYPLAQAVVYTEMADQILEGFNPGGRGNLVSTEALEAVIENQGGAEGAWLLPEAGILHRLARHMSIYELDLLRPEATSADVEAGLAKLANQHLAGLQEKGFSGVRAHAVALDASWWLERGLQGDAPASTSHADIMNRMRASVELAQYEADLLSAVTLPAEQASGWSGWLWVGLGALLSGLVGLTVVVRRRTAGARQRGDLAPALLVVLLISSAFPFTPNVEAGPTPAEPFPDPFLIAADGVQSWGGSVLVADDGTVHFAYAECLESGAFCPEGRLALQYRTLDAATQAWSSPVTLVDMDGQDAYMPRIVEDGQGLAVVWQQGIQAWTRDKTTEHPAELWWCRLDGDSCTGVERISEESVGVESSVAAVGPDGHLRVAWSQKASTGMGEVMFRERSASGWGPLIRFLDGGADQWQPALTVDSSNVAHLAWPARHSDIPGQAYRVVYHTTVHSGAVVASESRDVSQHLVVNQGVALAARGDVVHLAYGTEEGLYHRALMQGTWTDAHLVSPTDVILDNNETLKRPAIRPVLTSTENGVAAAWLERVYPHDGFRIRMAELNNGLWLRPTTVLEPPRQALFNPHMDADDSDRIHLTWSGDAPPDSTGRQQYLTVALGVGEDVEVPDVSILAPLDGSWFRKASVNLTAQVALEAPLDEQQTEWLLDGQPIQYEIRSNQFLATATNLNEGPHNVELTVADEAGNKVVTQWSFGVDRTRPTFDADVLDVDGAPAIGWNRAPVRVTGEADQDGGAPVTLEVQAIRDSNGQLVQLSPGKSWTEVPDDGLQLPPNVLMEVTVRARDAAGNVALGDPIMVGWDDDAPGLDVTEPPAWYTSRAPIVQVEPESEGSPVTLMATLTPDEGGPTHDVTVQPTLAEALVQFSSIPDGAYTLYLKATDAAGNEAGAGPWQVGVDATKPTLAVEQVGNQLRLMARDTGSGVASIQVLDQETSLATKSGEGANEATLDLDQDLLGDAGATVLVRDMAGNEARKNLEAGGILTDVPERNDLDEVGGDGNGGPEVPGKSWNVPGMEPTLLLLGLSLLAICRRRRLW